MGRLELFHLSQRYEGLDTKNDILVSIAMAVPFESFRAILIAAPIKGPVGRHRRRPQERGWGRKPLDEARAFKALVFQALYNFKRIRPDFSCEIGCHY